MSTTEGNAPATTTPAAPAVPDGARYAVARWIELTDDDAPWWAKPTGVGVRLQLHELLQLAAALRDGEVIAGAVKRLVAEARAVLLDDHRYFAQAFPELASRLRAALSEKEASQLLPDGGALARVDAALTLLDQVGLIDRIVADVSEAAAAAGSLDDLQGVDERITLLDAELVFDGYSREWRAAAARETGAALDSADSLAAALEAGMKAAGRREPGVYDVLVPLVDHEEPSEIALTGDVLEVERAEEIVASWPDGADLIGDLDPAKAVLRLPAIDARDIDSAAEQARDRLGRVASFWKLQGGRLEFADNLLLHGDSHHLADRRPVRRPLVAPPAGLKAYAQARKGHEDHRSIRRIADALDQFAQARDGSHGATLADLWTVAETLFGGVAEDKSAEVSDRLAGLAEHLYVRDLLRWFGARFDQDQIELDGLTRTASQSDAEWGLRCAEQRPGQLLEKLADEHPLEWARLKQFLRWDRMCESPKGKCQLGADLDAVRDRVAAVGNRAYLVRNLFLHQGNPQRAAAMAVTLPIFASVVHVAIGYINTVSGGHRLPLLESSLAELRVREVSAAYVADPRSGPDPLAALVDLSDD